MESEKILVREFELIPEKTISPPTAEVEKDTELTEKETEKTEKTEKETEIVKEPEIEKWYSIDNDSYEVKSIRATLLPDAIKMFCQS